MNRRTTVAVAALLTAAMTASPALAKSKPKKPKPLKGTWSFTDTTPDPTVDAGSDNSSHCHGNLPASPLDVNTATLKVSRPGTLTVNGNSVGDWAMEVRNSKGDSIAGADVNPPAQESVGVDLPKGTWTVFYCNLTGAPTATASYTFVFK